MTHPSVNRYRSGAKNPHREVLVAELEDGQAVAHVIDWSKGTFQKLVSPLEVDEGKENLIEGAE